MLRAVGKNVIIEKDPEPDASPGGIILLKTFDKNKEKSFGTLVSVGSGVRDPDFSAGRRVAFVDRTVLRNNERYNPCEIEESGKTLVLTDVSDVESFLD